uniref:DUF4833 domain-containing protein n=1 Tax=Trypanosoma congolense (strain IL3000) TaxID=1068625 RepID=G0UVE8_TRYCI|nr:conserved hypothetical protein [Trypanosoma congolense IL3000]
MAAYKTPGELAYALYNLYKANPAGFNRMLRERIGERGKRFMEDHPDTFMYIERSKNANIVAYTARFVDPSTNSAVPSGVGVDCVLKGKDPVHAYFITLDPEQMAKLREKGRESLIDDLNFVQNKLAYGCSGKKLDPASTARGVEDPNGFTKWIEEFQPFSLSYVALSKYPTLLLTLKPFKDDQGEETNTTVVLIAVVGGVLSVLKRIYVSSTEPKRFYELPTVNYIEVFGVCVEDGTDTYEKKLP